MTYTNALKASTYLMTSIFTLSALSVTGFAMSDANEAAPLQGTFFPTMAQQNSDEAPANITLADDADLEKFLEQNAEALEAAKDSKQYISVHLSANKFFETSQHRTLFPFMCSINVDLKQLSKSGLEQFLSFMGDYIPVRELTLDIYQPITHFVGVPVPAIAKISPVQKLAAAIEKKQNDQQKFGKSIVRLEKLDLGKAALAYNDFTQLFKALQKDQTLHTFKVLLSGSGNYIDMAGVEALCELIRQNSTLTTIEINALGMDQTYQADMAQKVIAALKENKTKRTVLINQVKYKYNFTHEFDRLLKEAKEAGEIEHVTLS